MTTPEYISVYKDPIHLAPGDHSIVQLIPSVFSGKSFLHWSRNMKIALISKNKLGFINGKCAKPADSDPKYQDWIRTNYTVMRWIMHSLSESVARSVSYVESSQQLWEELEERFNQTNAPLLYQLRKDMMQINQGDDSVAEYYSCLKSVWEDLKSLDGLPDCSCGILSKCSCNLLKKVVDRENKHMLIDFLMGLDKKYDDIRGQILAMDPLPSVNQAFSKIHQAELQKSISNTINSGDLDGVAMAVQYSTDVHQFSGKSSAQYSQRHPANVWRRDSKKPRHDRSTYFCDFCKKSGHTKEFCYKLRDLNTKSHASRSTSSTPKFAAHVEEISPFEDDTPCEAVQTVPPQSVDAMINPKFVQAVAQEMCKVFSANPPDFTKFAGISLASSAASTFRDSSAHDWIIDSGASDHMTFDFGDFYAFRPLTKPIVVSLPDGKIKYVQYTGEVHLTTDLDIVDVLYLRDFKHRLLSLGRLLQKLNLVANFTSSSCTIQAPSTKAVLCTGYKIAGVTNCPFQLIHVDLWGPYRILSLSGAKYFLTILDDYSRMTWTVLLKDKSLVSDKLSQFLAYVSTQFHTTVATLRSDNGTEILQQQCGQLLASRGIIHQKSIPGNPQQNGKVERKHRHLLEVARALRFHGHLPKRFWGEMVLAATHLINLMPTYVLKWKTPHEKLFQKQPDYSMLRVIGCLAYAARHDRDKFEARAVKCIMLGYPFGQKGYRLYDLVNHKIILSRDVVFRESEFPYSKDGQQSVQPQPSQFHAQQPLICHLEESTKVVYPQHQQQSSEITAPTSADSFTDGSISADNGVIPQAPVSDTRLDSADTSAIAPDTHLDSADTSAIAPVPSRSSARPRQLSTKL
ncbi:hypothetical protein RND81_04G104900 [Saponaria officinalis]|uniref:Integrase catalytic domain-containing protein n=1 Tax=Saponaria officinalis TaxID=3572 RepID=A0AAW1LLP0_SAPOF